MQLRVKPNRSEVIDFSDISSDKHFMTQFNSIVNQLIKDNQANLINKLNQFILSQNKARNDQLRQNITLARPKIQFQEQNQPPYVDQQLELSRKEIFITLLMMYSNIIDKENQYLKQTGFYQLNMELIKQNKYQQSQEKLKCLHSYFINFYNRFLQQSYDQNDLQQQINMIESQIQEEKINHSQKISQLNQRLQIISTQLKNNKVQKDQQEINEQNELVTFIRRTDFRQYYEIFNDQQCPISNFIGNKGRCEDYSNSILVNFADKNVGGLSLDPINIAQEEILMLTHPEALVSMLFMDPMEDNEAILIRNVIRYNDYDGYEKTFRQKDEEYFSQFKVNSYQNKKIIKNHILCMDALCYQNWQIQFEEKYINREIIKSYVSFSLALDYTINEKISTGKWGCGIFNGNIQLKFLIQLLAFSKAQRDYQNKQIKNQGQNNKMDRSIIFSAFHDNQFEELIQYYQNQLINKNQIYCIILIQEIENLKKQIKQQRISQQYYK